MSGKHISFWLSYGKELWLCSESASLPWEANPWAVTMVEKRQQAGLHSWWAVSTPDLSPRAVSSFLLTGLRQPLILGKIPSTVSSFFSSPFQLLYSLEPLPNQFFPDSPWWVSALPKPLRLISSLNQLLQLPPVQPPSLISLTCCLLLLVDH